MAKKKITEYEEVSKWLNGKPRGTKYTYLIVLRKYCNFTGMNPKQLIDEAEVDRKKSRRERGKPEERVMKFHEWMLKEKRMETGGYKPKKTNRIGASQKYAHTSAMGAKSFYRTNGFPLNVKIPKAVPKKENRKLNLRAEDVKKLVNFAPTLRDKAIILMLFQSGMDVSTLCSLDYGDVARELKKGECPLPIHVIRKKRNIEYTTFVGRDSIEVLKSYLKLRKEKYGELKLNNPLFVKERVTIKESNKRLILRITPAIIQKMLKNVAILSGVVSKEEMERAYINPCRVHALRASFSSILKLEGVNNEVVEYWMGHIIPYDGAYFIQPEDKLKEIYAEHEEALSINRATEQVKKLEKKTNDEIAKLYMEKRALEKRIEEMEQSKKMQIGDELIKALENPKNADRIIGALEGIKREKRQ